MLGYIIEGTPTRIVENINEILLQATRSDETLKKKKLDIPYLEDYDRIRQEVRQIVEDEITRIKNDPELRYLIKNEN